MEKAYNVSDIQFDNNCLILKVDNESISIKLSEISNKLANASEQELNRYKVSPSGYGIHWNLLDEDISITGLLDLNEKLRNIQLAV